VITAVILCFGFLLANGNTYNTNGKSSTFFFGVILFALSQLSMSMAVSTLFRTKTQAFSASLWLMLIPFSLTIFSVSEMLAQA
jgi:ABC-type transport system involved in multi-copper enzyme maturation permease subunit